ncbi:MAG: hypothetical protein KC656_22605, partial [Myxococcales bacterium]|nr:hypothetical protein [Myxococcales bacterium]
SIGSSWVETARVDTDFQNSDGEWEQEYRGEVEWSGDESTYAAMNPEGLEGVGLVMGARQDLDLSTDLALYDIAERLPNGTSLPPEVIQAYLDNDMGREFHKLGVGIALSDDQLDLLLDQVAYDDDVWAQMGSFLETGMAPGQSLESSDGGGFRIGGNFSEYGMETFMADAGIDPAGYRSAVDQLMSGEIDDFHGHTREELVELYTSGENLNNMEGILFGWEAQSLGSRVKSREDFMALEPEEQEMFRNLYEQGSRASYQLQDDLRAPNPWYSLAFTTIPTDQGQRDEMFRELFLDIEREVGGVNAVLQFQQLTSDVAEDLPPEVQRGFDNAISWELIDKRVESNAREWQEARVDIQDPEGEIAWAADRLEGGDADKRSDWLRAIRDSSGPAMVEQVVDELMARDPEWLNEMLADASDDSPARRAMVDSFLAGTSYARP